jgi:thiamine biosynthesis lipoprotein
MAAVTRRALLTGVSSTRTGHGASDRTWLRVHRTAMACRVEVLFAEGGAGSLAAARAALEEADRLESMLTVFRDTSDLVRVNRCAAQHPVHVPRELFEVLQRSLVLHHATDRAFDVSSTPLSRCWGFLRREGRLPLPAEIEAARACVDMDAVILDAEAQTVALRHAGIELNLGAIGKGFVLDHMAAGLRASGVRDALVSAGRSSLVAIGGPEGVGGARGWRVDLRSMVRDEIIGRLLLRDGAVGTSGAGEQFFELNGIRYGHVIDPRTGWPSSGVRSASVVAASAADADALSTAFLVGGIDLASRYCSTHADVLAVVTPDDGQPRLFGGYRQARLEVA